MIINVSLIQKFAFKISCNPKYLIIQNICSSNTTAWTLSGCEDVFCQADKDGNEKIDFSEFSKLWVAIRGEGEVKSFDLVL